jgi:soluble P-type ATPase
MADYTYDQLKDMTVAQLRDIAKDLTHEAVKGFSAMHKEQLLPALCNALGIHVHHVAVGAEKAKIKAMIRGLKTRRDEVKAAGDPARLAVVRRQIHAAKRKLRRMALDI